MLWGAFNNASSAMQVFTTDLGSISTNIANVNTTGYKRQEMMFSTVMSEHHASPSSYLNGLNIFGVQATARNLIQAQGALQTSTTHTDLAFNGRGFFMVAPPQTGTTTAAGAGAGAGLTNVPTQGTTNDPSQVLYTRAGNWHRAYGADSDPTLARSYFLNDSGAFLLGWMADSGGNVDTTGTLEAVYTLAPRPIANNGMASVNPLSTATPTQVTLPGRATTSATMRANLPSQAAMTSNNFTTTQSVVDPGNGTATTMSLNWTRADGNTWTVTPSIPGATINSAPLSVESDPYGLLTLSAAGADAIDVTWASTATSTLNLLQQTTTTSATDPNGTNQNVTLTWDRGAGNSWTVTPSIASALGTVSSAPVTVQLDPNGNVISPTNGQLSFDIDWDPVTYGAATTTTTNMALAGKSPTATVSGPAESLQKIPLQVFDDQYNSHEINFAFERAGTNTWYLHILGGDGTGAPPEPIKLEYGDPTTGGSTGELVAINGVSVNTGGTHSPITLNWTVTDPTTGLPTATTATIDLDMTKLTQYDSPEIYIGNVQQDGYARGNLASTEFNSKGEMIGYYDNGHSHVLFQLAVATFVSENELDPVSGTLFRRTEEAGALTVGTIDDVPGDNSFVAGALEASTVDIEDEFTRMIMTQKAYSTNAQVFKTADEMTTTARDLKN